ncbi:MAG TPA: flagellar basal-body rod protein FlgF [Bryobacteraceae bacterium]|nr:flagellar basal-body rod protein FlgF [Bryobacteraceae bacterium]
MDALTISAASGMRARMESLEMLANNLANVATGGYKADREFYSLYASPEAQDGTLSPAETLPVIERQWTDFSAGTLRSTGDPLNVALSGSGFFAVEGPSGPLYTRNGSLHLAADGTLTSAGGYPVRNAGGGTLRLNPSVPIVIDTDGTIRQQGQAVGRMEVVAFPDSSALGKQGSTYFRAAAGATPAAGTAEVLQGSLEESNVGAPQAAVRLVALMRQFEMLQKAVTLGGEMNRRAVEEVARPGS